ncbi:MAG TPA: hypothetical protein DDW52_16900 [Planctomycetaceae bacterium]|nr:hypothetical protein [Planctomycetaceae bacterium]
MTRVSPFTVHKLEEPQVGQDMLSKLLPQFGIWHILLLTSLAACMAAFYLVAGPLISFGVVCVVHGLAPTLGILCFAISRNQFLGARLVAAFGLQAMLTIAMLNLAFVNFGVTAIPWIFVAMIIEWPGQFLVGIALYLVSVQPNDAGHAAS